jgi:hypothetical protein
MRRQTSGWAVQHGIACTHCASGVTQQPGSRTKVGSKPVPSLLPVVMHCCPKATGAPHCCQHTRSTEGLPLHRRCAACDAGSRCLAAGAAAAARCSRGPEHPAGTCASWRARSLRIASAGCRGDTPLLHNTVHLIQCSLPADTLMLCAGPSQGWASASECSLTRLCSSLQICRVLEEAAAGRRTWPAASQGAPAHQGQHKPSRNPKHVFSQAERRAAQRTKLIKKFSAQVLFILQPAPANS